jgi:hypothetical protein
MMNSLDKKKIIGYIPFKVGTYELAIVVEKAHSF